MRPSVDAACRFEDSLVLRAQLGDRDALDELYRRLSPKLFRYISAIVRNDASAEDLLQEVLLIIYRKIRWLDHPESFQSCAYRLAGREAIRAANKGRRRQEVQLSDVEWSAIQQHQRSPSETRLLHEAITRQIEQLSPASRAVLSLHYMEDMEIAEAAAVLNLPIGTAKSRLAFGIERLRQRLGGKRREENRRKP